MIIGFSQPSATRISCMKPLKHPYSKMRLFLSIIISRIIFFGMLDLFITNGLRLLNLSQLPPYYLWWNPDYSHKTGIYKWVCLRWYLLSDLESIWQLKCTDHINHIQNSETLIYFLLCRHNEYHNLQNRTNFRWSRAWQIFLIFNTGHTTHKLQFTKNRLPEG